MQRPLVDRLKREFFTEPSSSSICCCQSGPIRFLEPIALSTAGIPLLLVSLSKTEHQHLCVIMAAHVHMCLSCCNLYNAADQCKGACSDCWCHAQFLGETHCNLNDPSCLHQFGNCQNLPVVKMLKTCESGQVKRSSAREEICFSSISMCVASMMQKTMRWCTLDIQVDWEVALKISMLSIAPV